MFGVKGLMKLDELRITDICNHYKPAVILKKGKVQTETRIFGIRIPVKSHPAYSYVKKIGDGEYKCSHCGIKLTEKQNSKIDEIVKYLNSGGDSDWKLAAMYKGIPLVETFKEGRKNRSEIVQTPRGYVPAKNEFNFYK